MTPLGTTVIDRPPGRRRPRLRLVIVTLAAVMIALAAGRSTCGSGIDRDKVLGGLAFVDEVEVTVVNIDVFVRDRSGRPVAGLAKDDFRLVIDGIERPLSHFAAYTEEVVRSEPSPERAAGAPVATGGPSGPRETAGEPIQPVHVVIYVDNENLHPHDRSRVLAQVRRFIPGIMQPHVRVMVVSAVRSTEVVQPFTDDPREVQNALRSMGRIAGGRVDAERQRGRIIRDLQEFSTAGNQRQVQAEARELEERIRAYGEELSVDLDSSVTLLRGVLTTLAGLQGRKVLVHVSSGLPAVPARDLIEWYGDVYQRASTLPLLARLNRRSLYNAVASTANAQGVTFYTIDASGLGGDSGSSAEYGRPVDPAYSGMHSINLQEPLLTLADSTGGRALVGANDATVLLDELRDDLFTYYSLGHTLPTTGADTVHRVSVELPDHPQLDVIYRRTLVERSLETQVQDTVVSGLMLALDDNPMELALSAGEPGPASDEHWILPVEVSIPLDSIALIPETDAYVGRVVLFVANRDSSGRQSDLQRREFEIKMAPDDVDSRRGERYVVEFDLLLNPGRHRIVIGALDPVTRQSSFVSLSRSIPR